MEAEELRELKDQEMMDLERLMPKQYWQPDKVKLFEITAYKPFAQGELESEWLNLIYMVKRGEFYKARDYANENNVKAKTRLRDNGDTILHVCAEFGAVKLFNYFHMKFKGELDICNDAGETPFIVAAREG